MSIFLRMLNQLLLHSVVVHNHHHGSKQQKQKLEGDLILAWPQNVVFTVCKRGTNLWLLCPLPFFLFVYIYPTWVLGIDGVNYYLTGKTLHMKCMDFFPPFLKFVQWNYTNWNNLEIREIVYFPFPPCRLCRTELFS